MSPIDYAITYHLACMNQEEANDGGGSLYITFIYKFTKTRIMSPSTNKINSRTPALRSAHKFYM